MPPAPIRWEAATRSWPGWSSPARAGAGWDDALRVALGAAAANAAVPGAARFARAEAERLAERAVVSAA